MIKIYHHPRCSKSREALAILEAQNLSFETIKYFETPLTTDQLSKIIELLKIKPIELVRKNEQIWKEVFKDQNLSDLQLVGMMVQNPKLMERPIVTNNDKAVIGRPPSKILEIL